MEIVGILLILTVLFICWALCASIPTDPQEDEEQERYLAEWERRHRK